jgi:hypothetical protein
MYQKTIIITQYKRYKQLISQMMRKKNREIENSLPLLSDLEVIKNDISQNKNTINIRGEFGYFIKQYGFPYMIIIDYIIDFGLSSRADPDNRKLVRTFLLAYTILAHAQGYKGGSAHIVFIVEKKHESTVKQFAKYPLFLLDQIRCKDEKINSIIDSFAKDQEKVKNFFKIAYILVREDGKYADELERLEKIMNIYDSIISSQTHVESQPAVVLDPGDDTPADVICRATIEKIIINGKLKPISTDQKAQYIEKNIHLRGAVTTTTFPVVQERILETFTAMTKINPFKKEEKIFIHISEDTHIDGSFASSMGTFLSSVLSDYTGISINIGKDKLDKLKKSPGFIAIKDFIFKNL